ncbi:MAG: nucleotidyltransferase domain-containing protein [bacterium]|nr:nucleotidyltransferase domain-containing protein [bacterium]
MAIQQNIKNIKENKGKNKTLPSYLTHEEKKAILEFAQLLRQRFGALIKEIILFGSYARKDRRMYSDIDILIVLSSLSWGIKKAISEIAAQENLKYNVLISTIRYDIDTWESSIIKKSPFGVTVREEGIWI